VQLRTQLSQERSDRQQAESLMDAATDECSNALHVAEQRALEWQKEIQDMQATIAIVRAERDAEEKQKRELEARLKALYDDFMTKMSDRLDELQTTTGRFAQNIEVDQRLQMLLGLQADLAAAMGVPVAGLPLPAPPYLPYAQRPILPLSIPSGKLPYRYGR